MAKRNFEPEEIKYSPPTGYAAIHSIPYTVAAALALGRFTKDELSDDAVKNTQVLKLARKVKPGIDSNFLDYQNAEVSIKLKDGKCFKHAVKHAIGSPQMPAPREIIEDKFINNSRHVLSEARMREVIDEVAKFDEQRDVSILMGLLK